jgi:hypothetical protein
MTYHIRDAVQRAVARPLALLGATISVLACQEGPTQTACCAPIAMVLSAPTLNLVVGEQKLVTVWTVDAGGRTAGAFPVWSSADVTVATVQSDGVVTAISPGSTTVSATLGALSATATVNVRPHH